MYPVPDPVFLIKTTDFMELNNLLFPDLIVIDNNNGIKYKLFI